MHPDLPSLLVFAAVTLGVTAGCRLVGPLLFREARQTRARLDRGIRKESDGQVNLFPNADQLTLGPSLSGSYDRPDREASLRARVTPTRGARLEALVRDAGLPMTVRQFLAAAAGVGVLLAGLGLILVGPLMGVAAGAVGGAVLPVYAHLRRKARRERLLGQLPSAFGLMARVIRSGHSVPQAVQAVTDAFEGPLAAEFARCQAEQNLGIRPEVSFREMADRTGILEVRLFVTAMLMQRQVGGNLSEILERLAALVRDRLRIRKQVRTLTAEGRLQGTTLLVLPFLVFGVLMAINRKYAEVLLDHPSLLSATGAVMVVGVLWIRKIIDFDI